MFMILKSKKKKKSLLFSFFCVFFVSKGATFSVFILAHFNQGKHSVFSRKFHKLIGHLNMYF